VIRDANNVATDLTITESFLGFLETRLKILGSIEDNGLDISKCRGQGYGVAADMSGVYSGVCRPEYPKAVYVHCVAHNLNLAIQVL
jgi:hypothetical protein